MYTYTECMYFLLVLQNTEILTMKFLFNFCSRAGIEDSKKWGMMFLSNQLFKIYFKVWTQELITDSNIICEVVDHCEEIMRSTD